MHEDVLLEASSDGSDAEEQTQEKVNRGAFAANSNNSLLRTSIAQSNYKYSVDKFFNIFNNLYIILAVSVTVSKEVLTQFMGEQSVNVSKASRFY